VDTRAWIAVGLVVGLAWATAPVFADEAGATTDVGRAEAFAADAFNAYTRKDYASAIALYQKALEAAPSADILYNLARIYDTKLKDRGLAIEYYRRYTLDTGADPNRLRAANARLSALRELEAIAAESPAPTLQTAPVVSGASAPPQPSPALPPPAAEQDRGLSAVQVAGILTGALGVAGLGVGIGFGFAAKNNADVADRFCNGNACTTQRGVEASQDAANAATVSTIAFVAGGALALLGIAAVLLGSGGRQEREVAMLVPYGAPGSAGAELATRW
jgi:tetratricopeptide (TPR) repeat protein